MSIQPLPQALITAHKLRQQAKELILLAEELEASVPRLKPEPPSVIKDPIFGEIKMRKPGESRPNKRRK